MTLMNDLYDVRDKIEVGKNPFTGRPKVFWKRAHMKISTVTAC